MHVDLSKSFHPKAEATSTGVFKSHSVSTKGTKRSKPLTWRFLSGFTMGPVRSWAFVCRCWMWPTPDGRTTSEIRSAGRTSDRTSSDWAARGVA